MQIIVCRFHRYTLPEKHRWLDKLMMPLSETIGTRGYQESKEFILKLEHPDIFLKRGSKFSVDNNLVAGDNETYFILLSWSLKFNNNAELTTYAAVREVKPTPFERWFSSLSQGAQYAMGLTSVLLPIIIISSGYYILKNYPEPRFFWSWFAENVRDLVGWGLFIFLVDRRHLFIIQV